MKDRTNTSDHTAVIDGKAIHVRNGQTILDAARKASIYIPTLCYLEHLPSYGGCRLCLVEVDGQKGFLIACTTPIEAGMVIKTRTPDLQILRGEILELTLSEHPYTCLVCKDKKDCTEFMHTTRKVSTITGCNFCTSNGDCELQELIDYLDLKDVKYPISYRGLQPEKNNPFYDLDYNLCILCGRCVRICNEERNSRVLAFIKRGNTSIVGTAFNESQLDAGCEFCGACVDVCPTGSISGKLGKWAGLPDSSKETNCLLCSIGCTMNVNTRGNRIIDVGPAPGGRTNPHQICLRGKFLPPDIINHPSRVTTPLIRREDKWMEVSWEEAIEFTADNLKRYKGKQFGAICSGQDTLEDNYLLQKFSRKAMRSNNIDLFASYTDRKLVREMAAMNIVNAAPGIDDVRKADTVLAIGTDASLSHPLLENRIRKAFRDGKTIIYANSQATRTSIFANQEIIYKPGEAFNFLYAVSLKMAGNKQMGNNLKKTLEQCGIPAARLKGIVDSLDRAQNLVIIAGDDLFRHESGMDILKVLNNIRFLKNKKGQCRILVTGYEGNHYAAVLAGVHPDLLPGFEPLTGMTSRQKWNLAWETQLSSIKGLSCNEMISNIRQDGINSLLVAGDIPAHPELANLKFGIQMNMFRTELSEFVDVFFPVTSFLENEGHMLTLNGKTRKLKRIVRDTGNIKSISEIISAIAISMSEKGFSKGKPAVIWKEILGMGLQTNGQEKPGQEKLYPLKHLQQKESNSLPLKLVVEHNHLRYRGNNLSSLIPDLREIASERCVKISKNNMRELKVREGEMVRITTGHGEFHCTLKSAQGFPQDSAILVPGNSELLALAPGINLKENIFNARIEKI